jgi:hypothetical protein
MTGAERQNDETGKPGAPAQTEIPVARREAGRKQKSLRTRIWYYLDILLRRVA